MNTPASCLLISEEQPMAFLPISSISLSQELTCTLIWQPIGSPSHGIPLCLATKTWHVAPLSCLRKTMRTWLLQHKWPLTFPQKSRPCLNMPATPILPLLSSAIGSFILSSTTTRSKHERRRHEQPYRYGPDSAGNNGIERQRA